MSEHISSLRHKQILCTILAVILAVGLMVPLTSAQADPIQEKRAEAAAALERLESYQATLSDAQANYEAAVTDQMAAAEKVAEAQAKIEENTTRIQELQVQLGDRARSMYRSGNLTFLDVFLGATTFQEFANNFAMLNMLNEKDAELVQETKDLRAELEAAKVEFEEQERVAAEKAEEARAVAEAAEATAAEMQATYDSLSAEVQELVDQQRAEQEQEETEDRDEEISSGNAGNSNATEEEKEQANANNSKPQSVSGSKVVNRAYSQIGKPYKWGAVGPSSYDCSGFVSYCLSGKNIRLGTTYTFMNWTRVSDPKPGDVCVNSGHCGIYIGGGQMIHAPHTGATVCVAPVRSNMIFVRY